MVLSGGLAPVSGPGATRLLGLVQLGWRRPWGSSCPGPSAAAPSSCRFGGRRVWGVSRDRRVRRSFSRESKLETTRLVKARRVLIVQAGRDLDVGENVLRRWIRELSSEHGQASPGQGQVRPERQEIRRLRCEVAKLQGGTRHPREGQSTCACRHYEAEPSRALATIPAMHPVLDGAAVDAAGLRQADTSPRPSAGAAL